MINKITYLALVLLLSLLFSRCDLSEKIADNKKIDSGMKLSELSSFLKRNDLITTCFADTKPDDTLPLNFGDSIKAKRLNEQPKSTANGYILSPGFYEMTSRSYCLQPGTYGPSKGDGYLYAPLLGERKEIIQALVRNSEHHLYIPQTTVQLLVWAVLARTNFANLSPELKAASIVLLSPEQLFELNGGA